MAPQSLGKKSTIEKLIKDINGLESVVKEIYKTIGRVDVNSWKYTTKKASDINLKELTDKCAYCGDWRTNQVSHIMLLELLIDRFLFLLHCVICYFELMFNNADKFQTADEKLALPVTMSISSTANLFWKMLKKLQSTFATINLELIACYEIRRCTEEKLKQESHASDNEQDSLDMLPENIDEPTNSLNVEQTTDVLLQKDSPTLRTEIESCDITASDLRTSTPISCRNISVQTYETAFSVCKACQNMQDCLMNVGLTIVNICESQSLPSSLAKQCRAMKNLQMYSSDVQRWATDQERDLAKINQYLLGLCKEIDPLKKSSSEKENNIKQLQTAIEILRKEKEISENEVVLLTRLYEEKCKELSNKEEVFIHKLTEAGNNKHKLEELQANEKRFKDQLKESSTNEKGLEMKVRELEEKLKSLNVNLNNLQNVEANLKEVNEALAVKDDSLLHHLSEIEKLKAENKALLKHDQGLQNKQAKLLSRLEQLDELQDEQQKQMDQSDSRCEELTNENTRLMNELKQCTEQLTAQKVTCSSLHDNIKTYENTASELNEKIQLLICYPVIGSEYERAGQHYADIIANQVEYSNENDVIVELRNQVTANEFRVDILQLQILKLKNSICKMNKSADSRFSAASSSEHADDYANMRTTSRHHSPQKQPITNDLPLVSRPLCKTTARNPPRPKSSNKSERITAKMSSVNRIEYSTPKGVDKARGNTADAVEKATTSCNCPYCNKEYLSSRDLEIHKSFCYEKL